VVIPAEAPHLHKAYLRKLLLERRQHTCVMEDENESQDIDDTISFNPHGVDLDALPVEHSPSSDIAWLDLNGLTAKESLGLSFAKNFAHIRK
jgi:hypothetical protein